MTNYKQGDLILFPYPFDDFSNSKKRPAIIIGNVRWFNLDGQLNKIIIKKSNEISSK